MKLDILAIGVHPDDVELGCSGTLINEIKKGKKAGVVDLTQGELSSRGTIESRYNEATDAGKIMGISVRENLKMRDGFFKNDEHHQMQLITVLRKYKPEIVIGNILEDRHPDHGRAGWLIYDSCFLSGLHQVKTEYEGAAQEKWRPKMLLHYVQDTFCEPDIIIDISDSWQQKLDSVKAYRTQFHTPGVQGPSTYISSPEFLDALQARARLFGKRIGVKYGEGFISKKNLGIRDLDSLVLVET